MQLQTILSSLIATYLAVSPCLALQHNDAEVESNQVAVEDTHNHNHSHSHGDGEEEGGDEHCCDDLSASIHAPVKELPSIGVTVAVVPTIEIIVPYVHTEQKTALSRDGPLWELSREHARTVVMLS